MIRCSKSALALSVFFVAISMMLLFTSGCKVGPTETREDSFTVAGYPRVVVHSENGSIELTEGGAGNEVLVKATLRDAHRVKYELSQVGDTITVNVQTSKRWWFFGNGGADIMITVPASVNVEL